MLVTWLALLLTGFATASQAAHDALNSQFPDGSVLLDVNDQDGLSTAQHLLPDIPLTRKHSALQISTIAVLSIAAVMALTFVVVKCFRLIQSQMSSTRRLAHGGEKDSGRSCRVSCPE